MEKTISSIANTNKDYFLPNTTSTSSNYGYLITISLTTILAVTLIALALWHGSKILNHELNTIRNEVKETIRLELKAQQEENQRLIQTIDMLTKLQFHPQTKLNAWSSVFLISTKTQYNSIVFSSKDIDLIIINYFWFYFI